MGPETHSFVSAFNRCLSSGRMLGSVQGLGTGSSATRRPESRLPWSLQSKAETDRSGMDARS